MEPELVNASIVVAAKDHKPGLLHPAFLRAKGVVPGELELVGDPISTPAFSRVQFSNGIRFEAELSRFQIVDGRPEAVAAKSPLPHYAKKLVEALPADNYRAVGINFTALIPEDEPLGAMISRFLRDGPWNSEVCPARDFGLHLTYDAAPGFVRLSVDAGEVRASSDGPTQVGILVRANYHADLSDLSQPNDGRTETLRLIDRFVERWKDYGSRVDQIFGGAV